MALVAYSDSEEDSSNHPHLSSQPPLKKRRRLSDQFEETSSSTPPLPASFHSLYSSSVRVSTSDDPSLHGGRKRIVPHIQGNWPTHVYLEWFPEPSQHSLLNSLVSAVAKDSIKSYSNASTGPGKDTEIHSLLETSLGVSLPLHISLSAPLVLRTDTKDEYLEALLSALKPLAKSYKSGVTVSPDHLSWHLNEDGSRGFLVLRVLEDADRSLESSRASSESRCEKGGASEKQKRGVRNVVRDEGQEKVFGSVDGEKEIERLDFAKEKEKVQRVDPADTESGLWDFDGTRRFSKSKECPASDRSKGGSGGSGLNELLAASNRIAKQFNQPELYASGSSRTRSSPSKPSQSQSHTKRKARDEPTNRGDFSGSFHISIAWALKIPESQHDRKSNNKEPSLLWSTEIEETLSLIKQTRITFDEAKVRIGKDVTSIPFGTKRAGKMSFFSNDKT